MLFAGNNNYVPTQTHTISQSSNSVRSYNFVSSHQIQQTPLVAQYNAISNQLSAYSLEEPQEYGQSPDDLVDNSFLSDSEISLNDNCDYYQLRQETITAQREKEDIIYEDITYEVIY